MSEIIEALFDTIIAADGIPAEKLFKPLLGYYGEYGDKLNSVYSELGLNLKQQNSIDEIIMDISYMNEQHGFTQGLKLGFKLAEEIYADKGGNTTP